jgi:hypothetical protein
MRFSGVKLGLGIGLCPIVVDLFEHMKKSLLYLFITGGNPSYRPF